ncbi:n-alkane-inducible cytochrome P450 [Pochonia chlamydosporia 170]|uniref:N-alkane-inducible cytochrome P450 n=1 Tax=Pochonia chlamydosporia 170 TaxID=1380566 RepID=A0A179F034_METCM|nr:n-alkane-inducible cytochrome P450 [Pochonia chlamydosporia 170]OAQ58804.1 n-alkane-inducible cytochrome P450 [Pochonia chlamydosporia 170]
MYGSNCVAGHWVQFDGIPPISSKVAILVFSAIGLWLCSIILTRTHNRIKDAALSRRLGCELPPELPKRWPLGIDRIKELWDSNAEGRLLSFLCSVAEDYEPGNNLYQYLLFGPRAYHILHPSNVEALLSTNFKDFGFGCRPAVFAPLLGNGIFTQEGAAWKHSRDLLRKQFVRTQYQNLHTSLSEHVDNLIASIPNKGVVDLQPLFFKLTMDVATSLLFGKSIYSLRAGVDQAAEDKQFAESFDIAQEGLAKRFRIAPFHFLYSPPKFRRACKNVHRYIEQYIDQIKCAKGSKPEEASTSTWFIDQLAAESLSKEDLRDQLLNVLLAGRDTTACCLSWTFRLLVRHESSLVRLRNEIASVLGDSSSPTRDQIQQMSYLSCVVKESLRLYPPVPLNNREAIRTTILPTGGGPNGDRPIMVRKGELVVFSQYVNSRRKNIYGDDANQFRHERWETGELASVGWAYFPFNGGPRQCLGQDFALMEVCYTVVRLLQAYSTIKLPLDEPNEPVGTEKQTLTLVLSSRNGCKVEVEK